LVERYFCKVDVSGSNPLSSTDFEPVRTTFYRFGFCRRCKRSALDKPAWFTAAHVAVKTRRIALIVRERRGRGQSAEADCPLTTA